MLTVKQYNYYTILYHNVLYYSILQYNIGCYILLHAIYYRLLSISRRRSPPAGNIRWGRVSGESPRLRPIFVRTSTKILDFRGFDSSRILILRDEIPRSIGDFPECLSQGILAGIILAERLGVGDLRLAVTRGWPAAEPKTIADLGGTTCLTLLVWYGLVCFLRVSLCQGSP